MTVTREQLEKAAKAAGIMCITYPGKDSVWVNIGNGIEVWNPSPFGGQLLYLAMACKIDIQPSENRIGYWRNRAYCVEDVNCQDFPALAEAVILAACEQFDAKDSP